MKKIMTLIFLLAHLNVFAQLGDLDNTFNSGSGVNIGILSTVQQTDGKLLIAGVFSAYNGTPVNNIVRINADGTVDAAFVSNVGTGFDNPVFVLALQPSGKILATGRFSSYNGFPVNRIARLNADGTLDTDFNPGFDLDPNIGADDIAHGFLTLPSSQIVVGGFFKNYNGTTVNGIMRINDDGSLDNTFGGGTRADGSVYRIVPLADGKMIIVGNFTGYDGNTVGFIARIDANGNFDPTFNPGGAGISGVEINAIIPVSSNKFLIGGNFFSYNGTPVNNIVRINADGTLDTDFNPGGTGADGVVYTLTEQPNGKILVGGQFAQFNGQSSPGIVRINVDGVVDLTFSPGSGAAGMVYDIVPQRNGKALVTGAFATYNGVTKNGIAKIFTDWAPDNDGVLFVKKGANGNGSSWQNAMPELATALVATNELNSTSQQVKQIFVTKGIYKPMYSPIDGDDFKPDPTDLKDRAFLLVKDVEIYGGFDPDNGISSLANSRIAPSVSQGSILSGDFNDDDQITGNDATLSIANNAENAYHVAVSAGNMGTAQLNGFALVGGNAQGDADTYVAINGEDIYRESGGGIYVNGGAKVLRNLLLTGNAATYGSALNADYANPTLLNCGMVKNYGGTGGTLSTFNANPTIVNCTIAGNGGNGGTTAINVGASSNPIIQNSIVWGGVENAPYTASYSLIQGSADNTNGNIDATGLAETAIFLDPAGGIYTLKDNTNVAFDKGNNSLYTAAGGNLAADRGLAGYQRLRNATIDIGAYELQQDPPVLPVNFGKFVGTVQNNNVKLYWNTFSETDNQLFTVYRSADAINYTIIATQASKGSEANSYTVFDNQPYNGVNYYRLTQKDIDGKTTILDNIAVNFSLSEQNVKIWPNPVVDLLTVDVIPGMYHTLVLSNINGQKLHEFILKKTQNSAQLNLAAYPKGVYIVQLKGENSTQSVKVLK